MSGMQMPMQGERQVFPLATFQLSQNSRLAVALLGIIFLVGTLYAAAQLAKDPLRFPVQNVDILGTMDYADRDALIASVKPHTLQGFYGLDIEMLQQTLEAHAWIATARVSRVWPSRIAINVEEHEPAARWNDGHLISKRLVLFKPHQLDRQSADFAQWSDVFRPLPLVSGAQGRHVELLDAYRAYEQQLGTFNLSLSLLEEDDRLSQTLILSNGEVIKLGREQRQLRMSRFLDVYERIIEKAKDGPLSFDMRYSSGFSLGVVGINET